MRSEVDVLKKLNKSSKAFQKIKDSENLLDKQVSDSKKILELSKKDSELNAKSVAKTNELVKRNTC